MWREELPENCPPEDALEDNDSYYRLVVTNPPTEEDFNSHRLRYPNKVFKDKDECEVRSISLFKTVAACESIKKFRIHKEKLVAKLDITGDSGLIKKTGGEEHYSFWPKHDFDIISACIVIP